MLFCSIVDFRKTWFFLGFDPLAPTGVRPNGSPRRDHEDSPSARLRSLFRFLLDAHFVCLREAFAVATSESTFPL